MKRNLLFISTLLFLFSWLNKARAQVITTDVATGTISACAGSASASPYIIQFPVSGSSLTGNITATAPTGFEVSLSPVSGYGAGVTLTQTGGTVNSTIVYVRSSASAAAGIVAGNVTLTSSGAATQTVAVAGVVSVLLTVNPVSNQTVNNGGATTAVDFTGTGKVFSWVNDTPGIGLAASGAGNIGSFTAVNAGSSPVTATITVTPLPTSFAYLPAGGGTLKVVDLITNTAVTEIPVGSVPRAVAISADNNWVYVANDGSNNVSVVSTATNTVTATIPVPDPHGIAVSPDGNTLYVTNSNEATVTVINVTTHAIAATVPAGNYPYEIVLGPDGSRMYVTNFASGDVSVINTVTNALITTIPVGPDPYNLAISPDGSRVYVVVDGIHSIDVINTVTNTVIKTIGVGDSPISVAVSPDGSRIYVTNNRASVSVISTATGLGIAVITAGSSPAAVSVSADGSRLYVTDAVDATLSVINTATNAVLTTIPIDGLFTDGNFVSKSSSCSETPMTFTITVNPTLLPAITAGIATGTISACAGSVSASPYIIQFPVSGSSLTGNITATAPSGFELSLSPGNGYGASVTLTQTGGTVNSTTVYVRSSASAPAGIVAGNVTLTSGTATQTVAVAGVVSALLAVNAVGNQTLNNGAATKAVDFTGAGNVFTWANDTPAIGLGTGGTGNIGSFTAVNTGSSPVTATITVTTLATNSAYLPSRAGNTLKVVNLTTNSTVTEIPVGSVPNSVAISPDNKWVYVANAGSNSISVVSAATNMVTATIPFPNPHGIAVSPDGNTLYITNYNAGAVTVINATTHNIVATIPTGNFPYEVVVSPDGSRAYITNFGSSSVSVINTVTNALVATIPVGATPFNLAISPDGSRVYVVDGPHNIDVINTIADTVINTISVGDSPIGVAVSPDGSRIYVTNNRASVSVISTATGTGIGIITAGSSPAAVSVSADGSRLYVTDAVDGTLSVINTATNAVLTTIPIDGLFTDGNFVSKGNTCSGTPVTFTITVNPTGSAAITTGAVTGAISACAGIASSSPDIQQFTVSGSNLTANITATAPTGFEVSLAPGGGYSGSLTLAQTGGNVNSTVVYVRSAASAPAGDISGNVTLTSGPITQTSTVNGVINASPTVNTVANQTVNNGAATTAIKFTGTGSTFTWVNDKPGIGLPGSGTGNIASFTAINNTGSPIAAIITVTPAPSTCPGIPVSFTIKVNPTNPTGPIMIPNTFTPNGDGVNDTWNIKNLATYPNCTVQVYNRYGENVYSSIGYGVAWDGTYKGAALPTGTYYYIIDLKNGSALLSGFVAIIR